MGSKAALGAVGSPSHPSAGDTRAVGVLTLFRSADLVLSFIILSHLGHSSVPL